MEFILSILINAAILIIVAKMLPKVHISGWGAAIFAALLIGIFNPTIGWVLRAILNVATLGIFVLFGLGFIIRLIVTAFIIKLVDWLMGGLRIDGFGTALLLAIIMALVGSILQYLLF